MELYIDVMDLKNFTFPAFKRWQIGAVLGVVIVGILLILYFNLNTNSSKTAQKDAQYNPYISAHSSGIISSRSGIRIQLVKAIADTEQIGQEVPQKLFRLKPAVAGKTYWIDTKTVEFVPQERLLPDTQYKVVFSLEKLLPEVTVDYTTFEFSVITMQQNFTVDIEGLTTYEVRDLKRQKLSGIFHTADYAEDQAVEKGLIAYQDGQGLNISWNHDAEGKIHRFTVENIQRGDNASKVKLTSSGEALKIDKKSDVEVEVPALGDFKLTKSEIVQNPEQYVLLQFSDPLQENQDLTGLIQIEGVKENLRFVLEGNSVRVYPSSRQAGIKTISIAEGVKNILGYKLKNKIGADLVFEQLKPAVRLVGKGVILPSTNGLMMPFEAVGLKEVDVAITQIFEDNVAQFFQVNHHDGQRELRRVGRPVIRKSVSLESGGVTDFGRWNRFTLDLANIIQTEPGAIYQVQISFRKQQSAYFCEGQDKHEEMPMSDHEDWDKPSQNSYYDEYEYDGDYYYPPGYDWDERENPCHISYYNYNRFVKRNVLASDLGLIAKQGKDKQVWMAVTDLKTAAPLANINVAIYNYQQRIIGQATTDAEGMVTISASGKPFLLIASQGNQKGYLRMDDGSSLTLSNFNVAGEEVQEGIKGFIYGDRSVWRPGDTLHLNFMLEDREKVLPANHPVVFELVDPQGNVVKQSVSTTPVGNLYNFSTKTSQDAPTGNWMAKVRVGGATFYERVKIETIKPNRLKINLDFGVDKLTANDPAIQGNLKVQWLTGVPARNLKASFDVILTRGKTVFKSYDQFVFEDMAREFNAITQSVFEGELDESGETTFTTSLDVNNNVPGTLNATFTGKVFEEGGNFSIDQFTLPYYPFQSFVGVKVPKRESAGDALLTDVSHTVDIVILNSDGKPMPKSQIEMELYKLDWRWWWDQSDENMSNYIGSSYRKPIQKGTIRASNGKAQWSFEVKKPDWGRFYIRACDPESGHCAGDIVYIDWPGYAGRGDREGAGGASMLMFSSDKDEYQIGEQATLHIPGSKQGKALVSIENGTRIVKTYWIDTKAGETTFSFPVTAEMTPNVYAHVSLLQPHAQTANDLPVRMYGIIPIQVNDPVSHLKPLIQMPQELAPQEQVTIKIQEEQGKPMAYTVAVVDEGLLDITRFKTPAPWNHFYAKEALGVKTWDLYEYVMGTFGGELERILAIGGDDELNGAGRRKAQRFKPVVQCMGPFFLEKGKTNTHTFMMPNYVGSVRTMVIAGYEGAYGQAEQTTPVRKPLMVLGTLPRVLGPDEEVKLPVNVFAMDKSVKDVQVNIKANMLLSLESASSKYTHFSQTGDQMVDFKLKVKPQVGIARVQIAASGSGEEASYDFEIDVRNPNPPVTQVIHKIVQPGETWNMQYAPVGMLGTNKATLEVSGIPPINLEKRLRYLLRYPHGCIEQTTSSAFPQLYVKNVREMTNDEKAYIDGNIKAAINRIRSFVTSEGGFGYWPGHDDTDEWGTNYAGHFLLEAQKQGYVVPAGILNNWKKYQLSRASHWSGKTSEPWNDLVQAYRLYTLALAGSPDKGAMNRLRERSQLTVQAKWRLAAAYALVGQPEAAQELIYNAEKEVKPYRELSYTYGSDLRDEAMILETQALMNEQSQGFELMKKISQALSGDQWMSTQTTAYCLIAVSQFIGNLPQDNEVNFRYLVNNKDKQDVLSELPVVQRNITAEGGGLQVVNQGKGVLYARIVQEGVPLHGDETAVESGLRVITLYKNLDGEVIDPSTLSQGTDFVAEVTIMNPGIRGSYQELALTQIFPSGWEIINTRLNDLEQFFAKDVPTYQDIRDDRVYTYFDLGVNERKTFKVLLNASYAGKFYLPAVQCEAMYDNTINARQAGQWVEVKEK